MIIMVKVRCDYTTYKVIKQNISININNNNNNNNNDDDDDDDINTNNYIFLIDHLSMSMS